DDLNGDGAVDTAEDRADQTLEGDVHEWRDRSPGRLRARQAEPAARPTWVLDAVGGRPGLRFDGRDFLNLSTPDALNIRAGHPFSVAVVYRVGKEGLGTFLAKGGGAVGHRAYQFYVTQRRAGAIAHGVSKEGDAPRGVSLALFTSDGRRAEAKVNGVTSLSLKPGHVNSTVDVLIGARRKNADNTGIHYGLRGVIAEILVYTRVLSGAERLALNDYLATRYGIRMAANVVRQARRLGAGGDALGAAELLLGEARRNKLGGDGAEFARELLLHEDPFVRGISEWTLSMKAGGENNGQEAVWPGEDSPEWFRAWQGLGPDRLREADYVRQAVSRELHHSAQSMVADIRDMGARSGRMADVFGSDLEGEAALALRGWISELAGLEEKGRQMLEQRAESSTPGLRRLWLDARRVMRGVTFANPTFDLERLVFVQQFAPHTVRNITRSYPWKHKPGGDIAVLAQLREGGTASPLLRGRLGPGFVWGLDLWWAGDRVVFGYARQPDWPPRIDTANATAEAIHAFALRRQVPPLHIFEATLDGAQLRQLTNDSYWNDFEPTYCPNGDVVFSSDRCGRSAQCGHERYDHSNPNLYIRSAGDSRVRQFTDNKDVDRYPHCLDNGSIAYTHWEYQERHFMEVHAVWTARADGRMSDAFYKHHMKAPLGLRDARSIPGTQELVAIATGHHTFAWGPVMTVDARHGLNSPAGLRLLTPGVRVQEGKMAGTPVVGGGVRDAGGLYQTPWALSRDCFLVSYAYARPACTAPGGVDSNGFGLYLIDSYGNRELLHREPLFSCTYPIPLRPRPGPTVAPVDDLTAGPHAVCFIPDVYEGIPDVARGEIKYVRIAQHVGWPFDEERGAMHYLPNAAGSRHPAFNSWSPVRVLGTVPVLPDGSACFRIPADTAVYFQALDAKQMEIRRMRSMVSLKPGEQRGCAGCHESQARAPAIRGRGSQAAKQAVAVPTPPPWGSDRLLGYEWLVQPVLDRRCTRCHSGAKPKSGVDLSGTRVEPGGLLRSYRTLLGLDVSTAGRRRPLVSTASRFSGAEVSKPRQFGSHRSRLIQVLMTDTRHREAVTLTGDEWLALVTWVDANAPYYDAFVDKRSAGTGAKQRNVRPSLAASRPGD
ncbi:MAG: hypothetical protein HON70_21205, partial [Lentisphaerae bacterium]|nr:hypothetical protein [Lentisphaerota bacterium]